MYKTEDEMKCYAVRVFEGKIIEAVESYSCNGCMFLKDKKCIRKEKSLGSCGGANRKDFRNIIFVEKNK